MNVKLPEPKLKSDAMENRNDDNEYVPCKNANCDPYYPTNESDSDDGQIEQTDECTLTAPEVYFIFNHIYGIFYLIRFDS